MCKRSIAQRTRLPTHPQARTHAERWGKSADQKISNDVQEFWKARLRVGGCVMFDNYVQSETESLDGSVLWKFFFFFIFVI